MRDAAQPGQRHGERVGPGPAGGQVQRPAPRGVGEPAGQGQQGATQGLGHGLLVTDAQAEGGGPADEVVGQGGGQQPGGVGGEPPGGQVGQAGARLEVADGQLADGVAAMIGVQPGGGADAVGDKRVVAPGGNQLLLVAQVADPTHDQPVASVGGLGDLGDPVRRVGDVGPGVLGDGGDGGADGLGLAHRDRVADLVGAKPPNQPGRPEPRVHPQGQLPAGVGAAQPGHQLVNEPENATGGVGRALAQPGVHDLAGVGAGGQQRVVAQPAGVAVAGTLLGVAVDLADGGVHI